MLFKDRSDAGRQLAHHLLRYKDQKNAVVLGLARGGVVVAAEVAHALHLPLNVLVVRKVGAPGNEELALGAVGEQGEGIFNDHLIGLLGVSKEYLTGEVEHQKKVIRERLALYRRASSVLDLKGKTAILVDDGIATGASMRVAIQSARLAGASPIVLAVPVASPDSLKKMEKDVDVVVCLSKPPFFEAVGSFYRIFNQTSDEEIVRLIS